MQPEDPPLRRCGTDQRLPGHPGGWHAAVAFSYNAPLWIVCAGISPLLTRPLIHALCILTDDAMEASRLN